MLNSVTRVKTGKVRFSYPNLFKARAMQEGQTPKFTVSILIPKTDTVTLDKVKAAIAAAEAAGKAKYGAAFKIKPKDHPLKDGDVEKGDDPVYKGQMYLSAKSITKPAVLDENGQSIISADDFYAGCYGRSIVDFYPYNVNLNAGVATGLQAVQFTEHGERLAGGLSEEEAANVFAEDSDDIL